MIRIPDSHVEHAFDVLRSQKHAAARAEFERERKLAVDVVEPLGQALRRLTEKKIVIDESLRRALAMIAHGVAVEDDGAAHAPTMALFRLGQNHESSVTGH